MLLHSVRKTRLNRRQNGSFVQPKGVRPTGPLGGLASSDELVHPGGRGEANLARADPGPCQRQPPRQRPVLATSRRRSTRRNAQLLSMFVVWTTVGGVARMRVLLVEDESELASVLEAGFRE